MGNVIYTVLVTKPTRYTGWPKKVNHCQFIKISY